MIVMVRTSTSNFQKIENPVNDVYGEVTSVFYDYGENDQNDSIRIKRLNGVEHVLTHPIVGEPEDKIYETLFVKVLTDSGVFINDMKLEGYIGGTSDE